MLRATFLDHTSYGVQPTWVNEKLLFIQAWWGRIEATELLLDIETGKPVTIENANFIEFTGPCAGNEDPR